MNVPSGEYGVNHTTPFRAMVDTLITRHGEDGESGGAYIPLDPANQDVATAIRALYGQGYLVSFDEMRAMMPGNFCYGEDVQFGNMSLSNEPVVAELTKPGKSAANKLGICAMTLDQEFNGVGVFINREGPRTTMGVRVYYSRKIYPGGYIVYEQEVKVVTNTIGPTKLIQKAVCEVIYEGPEEHDGSFEIDTLPFLNQEWEMASGADYTNWMMSFICRDLRVNAKPKRKRS